MPQQENTATVSTRMLAKKVLSHLLERRFDIGAFFIISALTLFIKIIFNY